MNKTYEILTCFSLPRHCANTYQQVKKEFCTQGTQTEAFEQEDFHIQNPMKVMLESIDMDTDNFRCREIQSIIRQPVSYLMDRLSDQDPNTFLQLQKLKQNDHHISEFIEFIDQQIVGSRNELIMKILDQYQEVLEKIVNGFNGNKIPKEFQQTNMSFIQSRYSDLISPGWDLTPNLRRTDSGLNDSILI